MPHTNKKVRVSSLLSSDVLLNNNMNDINVARNANDNIDEGSAADSSANDDDRDDDGPPSVIATYTSGSPLEASNHYLNEAIGDSTDDESGTLIDSIERDELNDDSSIESSVDDTELELEDEEEEEEEVAAAAAAGNVGGGNDKVEVTAGTLGEGVIPVIRPDDSTAAVVPLIPVHAGGTDVKFAAKVKSLINKIGTTIRNALDIPEDSNDRSSSSSYLPILKAFLYLALIPMCSYVLREATFVTRDVSIDLRERGIIESLFLLHIMVGMNMLFSMSIMVCVVSIFLDPSRLSRFVASLDTTTPQKSSSS